MVSIRSSRQPIAKASSDSATFSFDLLSNLTYMAALAISSANRDRIFENATLQNFKTAIYFRQVYLLTKRLGFEYTRAFQVVAKQAKATVVKALLLRFPSSINSGESEQVFLAQEAAVEREVYASEYNRKLETLQKWTDAYAAILVPVAVIVVVAMVSIMLYQVGEIFVIGMAFATIMIMAVGSWVIYKAAPVETRVYKHFRGPKVRRLAIRLFRILAPLGALAGIYMASANGVGWGFLTLGIFLAPVAVLAMIDDGKTNKADQNAAGFVRALGNITGALGSTLSVGLNKLDQRSMGPLEPHIKRLQARPNSRQIPTCPGTTSGTRWEAS